MKKKYIQSSSRLFISLVAIGTLVSCATTKNQLGVKSTSIYQAKEPLLSSVSTQQEKQSLDVAPTSNPELGEADSSTSPQTNRFTLGVRNFSYGVRNLPYQMITAGRQMTMQEFLEICQGALVGAIVVGLPLGQYLSRLLLTYPSSCPQPLEELLLPPLP